VDEKRKGKESAMKGLMKFVMVSLMLMMAIQPAWAVDTTQTYRSGILVLIFIGICALLVVAQLVPALIVMMGAVSGFARKMAAKKEVAEAGIDGERSE